MKRVEILKMFGNGGNGGNENIGRLTKEMDCYSAYDEKEVFKCGELENNSV